MIDPNSVMVKLPLGINIIGSMYHAETSQISEKYILVKVYLDDFEYIPPENSHIYIFLSLNLFNRGILELKGKIVEKENIEGGRLAIWIEYETYSESDQKKILDFINHHYTPRYSVRFSVDVLSEHHYFSAEAVNVSENGIFIESSIYPIDIRSNCILTLHLDDDSFQLQAELSWINKGQIFERPIGYGFKFIHTNKTKHRIKTYLEKLKDSSEILR
jgi:Tfp pilus assembly protein PilZ